jgi:hypothetical protein
MVRMKGGFQKICDNQSPAYESLHYNNGDSLSDISSVYGGQDYSVVNT